MPASRLATAMPPRPLPAMTMPHRRGQCGLPAQFSPQASVVGRTCYEVSHHFSVPCDQAGESCPLAGAREAGQRERVLHLHHTPRARPTSTSSWCRCATPAASRPGSSRRWSRARGAGRARAEGLIGRSPAFQQMLELVARVGPSEASVLLLGESGTGKELVARAVHEASPRAAAAGGGGLRQPARDAVRERAVRPREGRLHRRAAAQAGLVEAASGGTLFLDEVGDIPLPMQVKLLRLLESGTYRRVGSTELRRTDVRVVSATHRDLQAMVADGRFREDLYYRLSTFPIRPAAAARAGPATSRCWRRAAGARGAAARLRCRPSALARLQRTRSRATCANCATCWSAPRC
jgi:two-component system response regulator HydG